MSASKSDVLIVGGGVVGLACAHYLLRAGRSVRVIERDCVGAATSHGNCGTITPSHAPPLAAPGMVLKGLKYMLTPDAPLYIKPRLDFELANWLLRFSLRCNHRDWRQTALAKSTLLHASRRLLEDLVREQRLDCEFAADGAHLVYRDPKAFARDCAELPELGEFGIESKVLSAAELAADEPALKPGAVGAIHYPGDAHLRPDRYCEELARLVRAAGGVIEEGVAARGFARENGRIVAVETADGKREGRDVLLALGPWSPMLSKQLGIRLPIQPGKGYSITYSRPASAPRRPLVLKERSVCVTTWAGGFRLGSTMEFSGYDASLNRTRLDALERGAREYLLEPTGPKKIEEWFGWRPMTYDDMPILGRAPGLDNLWLATGHGMLGVTLSAVTGRLLTDLICGDEPIVDPAASAPQRFA